jgi:hypothetical protein
MKFTEKRKNNKQVPTRNTSSKKAFPLLMPSNEK